MVGEFNSIQSITSALSAITMTIVAMVISNFCDLLADIVGPHSHLASFLVPMSFCLLQPAGQFCNITDNFMKLLKRK